MSGGASAAAAARYFDGDADAILRLPDTKKDALPVPFKKPGLIYDTDAVVPTFKTGKHAVMVSGVKNPADPFEVQVSGDFAKDMIELYCGVVLESQLAHGPLPDNNYPRTFLVGPRAGFGSSTRLVGTYGMRQTVYEWAKSPRFTGLADEYKPNVFDYDRIISVNHFAEIQGRRTVLILIADLDHQDATDGGTVIGTAHACTFSQGGRTPNLDAAMSGRQDENPSIPLADGETAFSMMSSVLDRLGLGKDKVNLQEGRIVDNPDLTGPKNAEGSTTEYTSWAGLAIEKLMRQKFEGNGGAVRVDQVLLANQEETPWRLLVEQAARVGYMPPRTIATNAVNWPSTTSQTAIVALLKRRLGVGIGSSIQMSNAEMDRAVSAILGAPSPELPAASYSDFNPPEEDDY